MKNDDSLQNFQDSEGFEGDPDKLRVCTLLDARLYVCASDSVPRATP
jgi:hypothetical protein